MDDKELAKAMGISRNTFYKWLKDYSDICDALTRGRGGAREQIENALYLAAQGGIKTVMKPMKRRIREYHPVTGKCMRDEEIIEQVTEEIYVPPNVEADKFYLTNRARSRWELKPEGTSAEEREAVRVIVDV